MVLFLKFMITSSKFQWLTIVNTDSHVHGSASLLGSSASGSWVRPAPRVSHSPCLVASWAMFSCWMAGTQENERKHRMPLKALARTSPCHFQPHSIDQNKSNDQQQQVGKTLGGMAKSYNEGHGWLIITQEWSIGHKDSIYHSVSLTNSIKCKVCFL